MIKQKKFIKAKEVEQTISIPKNLMDEVDRYISVANIEHGIVRAGEAKSTQEARREYFIVECIKEILKRDREEIEAIEGNGFEEVEDDKEKKEVSSLVSGILGDDMDEIASTLEE